MRIRKIFLSLLALIVLLGGNGKVHAEQAPNIRIRCEYLVKNCGLYSICSWGRYVSDRMRLIEATLDYFCENRESFKFKGKMELLSIAQDRLAYFPVHEKIETYDNKSILCANDYGELVYNLCTVYLTYFDVFNPTKLAARTQADERALSGVELFWKGTALIHQKRAIQQGWVIEDNMRVNDEISRRMQRFGLSILPGGQRVTRTEGECSISPVQRASRIKERDGRDSKDSLGKSVPVQRYCGARDGSPSRDEFSGDLLAPIASRTSSSCRDLPSLSSVEALPPRPNSASKKLETASEDRTCEPSDFVAELRRSRKYGLGGGRVGTPGSAGASGGSTPTPLGEDGKPLPPLRFGMSPCPVPQSPNTPNKKGALSLALQSDKT